MTPSTTTRAAPSGLDRTGLLCALGCFSLWGLFPIYFKLLRQVPPSEVLAHRILWSVVVLLALIIWRGQGASLRAALRDWRRLGFYSCTSLLIAGNWLLYIWAVQQNRILEASLGYYINPLINVVLGVLFLRERLNRRQWSAIALAGVGVLVLVIGHGTLPWVSLVLALSFGTYGLLRKKDGQSAILGLGVETGLIAPVALLFLLAQGGGVLLNAPDWLTVGLLIAAGPATVVPLLLFLAAGQRLPLSTLGLIQYMTPTLQLLQGVLLYHEPFTLAHALSFGCIWSALALYSADAVLRQRHRWRNLTPPT